MALEPLAYACDGLTLNGWIARAQGPSRPAVLVAHEAPGLNDHVRGRAQALAEEGWTALALDLYGAEGFPLDEAMARHTEMMTTPGLLLRRARAAYDLLAGQPGVDAGRMAAIGFCQGGVTAMELARAGLPLRAAIGFHPGLTRPAGSPDEPIAAKVLMLVGDRDPVIPPEHRTSFTAEMTQKGVDWQLHVFGGVGHSFTNPAVDTLGIAGFAYDASANARAWSMALDLLREGFGEL